MLDQLIGAARSTRPADSEIGQQLITWLDALARSRTPADFETEVRQLGMLPYRIHPRLLRLLTHRDIDLISELLEPARQARMLLMPEVMGEFYAVGFICGYAADHGVSRHAWNNLEAYARQVASSDDYQRADVVDSLHLLLSSETYAQPRRFAPDVAYPGWEAEALFEAIERDEIAPSFFRYRANWDEVNTHRWTQIVRALDKDQQRAMLLRLLALGARLPIASKRIAPILIAARLAGSLKSFPASLEDVQSTLACLIEAHRDGKTTLRWQWIRGTADLLAACVRWLDIHGGVTACRPAITELCKRLKPLVYDTDEKTALRAAMQALEEPWPFPVDPGDDWGFSISERLGALPDGERDAWVALLSAAPFTGAGVPSAAWKRKLEKAVAAAPHGALDRLAGTAFDLFCTAPNADEAALMALPDGFSPALDGHHPLTLRKLNGDILSGLVWAVTLMPGDVGAEALVRVAEASFKSLPTTERRSVRLGNACIRAIGALATVEAVGHLVRLGRRINLRPAKKLVEEQLQSVAAALGMTRQQLEDLAAPSFNLEGGGRVWELGDAVATLALDGPATASLVWTSGGKAVKSVPAAVARDFPDELKEIKATAKELGIALAVQRGRLEGMLVDQRAVPFDWWCEHFRDHPLVGHLAKRLIWSFEIGAEVVLGAWDGQRVTTIDGAEIVGCGRVVLWHPATSDDVMVAGWQRWLEERRCVQPFKQAHREVYLLTEAERRTGHYSNRFAAHIVRQHQVRALFQGRGWQGGLQGGFDNGWDMPRLELPAWGLRAELDYADLHPDTLSEAGISLYVTVGKVEFHREGERQPVALADVPPIAFSEVMRDVDLFVSVASVAHDWQWVDRAREQPAAGGYLTQRMEDDLTPAGSSRRALLERILPGLPIAGRCSLTDRFLVVRGDRHTYRIHLNSSNIYIEPANRYLCIVPAHGKDARHGRIFLPFEGDQVLSTILSKAILLANDTAITDRTILSQLERR